MDKIAEFNKRIDDFLTKYYRNQIIKGLLLSLLIAGILLIATLTLEFIFWFSSNTRLFLFSILIVSIFFVIYYYVLIPILRLSGILNKISINKTANILSTGMPDLKDYLYNIVELQQSTKDSQNELLYAAINQKINYTANYNFNSIIKNNLVNRLIKFIIFLSIFYATVLLFKPDIIVESGKRLIHYKTEYVKENDYKFVFNIRDIVVERGEDLNFSFEVEGENIPEQVFIYYGGNEYLCSKISIDKFSYKFKNVNNNISFRLGDTKRKSEVYEISVISTPYVKNLKVVLNYPKYTGLKNAEYVNQTNFKCPVGTIFDFYINVDYADKILYSANRIKEINLTNNVFNFQDTIYKSSIYSVKGLNKNSEKSLITNANITVIPDLYPEIEVVEIENTKNKLVRYFKGIINDDYGFSNLFFQINDDSIPIDFNPLINSQEFYFTYQFDKNDAYEFTYYFEVLDNDKINGFKSSVTDIKNFKLPDFKEISDLKNSLDEKLNKKIEKSLELTNELKDDINDLKNKLFSEKMTDYEKNQLLENINLKQNNINDIIQEIKSENVNKNNELNSFNEYNDEILKKQEKIEDLLNKVMDKELEALLDELKKLAEEYNNDEELLDRLKDLEFNYNKLSEQLDKNMEVLKKFEVERNLENIANELENISEEHLSFVDSSMNQSLLDSVFKKELENFRDIKKEYQNNLEKNKELEKPFEMDNLTDDFKDIEDILDNDNKKQNDFKESGKKSDELAKKLNSMLNNNRMNENGENAETLRQILENLIYFSFIQEDLNNSFIGISQNSPVFYDNVKLQQNLEINFSIIKDSLFALSKRTPNVGNHINEKTYAIEKNLISANELLIAKKLAKANISQRTILQNANDLILLLSESLKNIENSSGEGGGKNSKKKNKPKQGEPSLSEMRKSQESIKDQLKSMISDMKNGEGTKGKNSSEKLAEMLMQQEMFQNLMNNFLKNGSVGSDMLKELNEINKLLEQNKRDIINNSITNRTLFRQNEIVTRLLESEKAEKERELDDKRESKESINQFNRELSKLFEENKKSGNFNDIIWKSNIRLNYYYQNKYQEYINRIEY